MSRKTERIGRHGEYYTASILALESDTVSILPHGSHADIIFELNDTLYKCQVKTKSKKTKGHNYWKVDLRRGSHTTERYYQQGQIDIYALYAQPYNSIVFLSARHTKQVASYIIKDHEMKINDSQISLASAIADLSTNELQPNCNSY